MTAKYTEQIQPGNKALKFIDKRIADDKYRGAESSEHNRYDLEEIHTIASLLNSYCPNKKLMYIRSTDLSKRPENTPEEEQYARFCADVKNRVGKGTQDSIRKNIFVDMHRMGLLKRYNTYEEPMPIFSRGLIKYVALSESGVRFAEESDLLSKQFMYTKALDILLGGYIETAFEILRDENAGFDSITKYEFMFFVSAINLDYSFSFGITKSECIELIKAYKSLARTQRKAVVETLKSKLRPELFFGDKTAKRDWLNWQNKIDQVFHLFKQTVYFDVSGADRELLTLSTRKIKTKNGDEVVINKRSNAVKQDYFKSHKIKDKTDGFELHHVVPLCWAETPEHFKLLDDWRNLVYIDAFSHAKITQRRNCYIIMSADNNDISLSDYDSNSVFLEYKNNIEYCLPLQSVMLEYNKKLNNTD